MQVSSAIAEILKREGVGLIIGYPVNPLFDAAAAADIRTIIVRQERTGVHMADGFSRVHSGRQIGVFTMQAGPGAKNAFGAVAQAYAESVPIVVIAGGYARNQTNVAPNFSSLVNYRGVTKACEQVTDPRAIADVMRRAFSHARNGRPGPVLVEVPADVWIETIDDRLDYSPAIVARSGPDAESIGAVATVLLAAKRPLIYAGQGVHYARAWPQLRELAELLESPVTTSLEGKSAFPEDHELSLGSGGRALPGPVRDHLAAADVVFGIGCSFTRTNYGISFPGKRYIQATNDPADLNKDLAIDHALVGDAQLVLAALVEQVREQLGGSNRRRRAAVVSRIAEQRQEWLASWLPKLSSKASPMSPYRVIWDLLHTVDAADAVITHDAGSPRDQLSPFWISRQPLSYLGWGKSTQLGYGLGLVMGAKLAAPHKTCINVWGDAAIGMTGMDLETAVRERIPILSILLNNFCMAVELDAMPVSTEKYRSTDISGNYADFGKALGAYAERVTEPAGIVPAIRRGIEETTQGRPALLEFITEQETTFSR